jgi:tetrapyrrole methylase family protein/MazG family protein
MDLYQLVVPALAALDVSPPAIQVQRTESLVARHHPHLNPDQPALIGLVESAAQCRALCTRLAQVYPWEHCVMVLGRAGTPEVEVATMLLAQVAERLPSVGPNLLYVPPLPCPGSVESFRDTVAHLRAPDGCPWDREQTHRSLRQGFQEEAYEVLDALDRGDLEALQEELGDILLHVLLQVQIATEMGEFRLSDVVCHVNSKIVYRHPHVFDGLDVQGVAEVLVNWETLKLQEKEGRAGAPSSLAGIPEAMPALARAQSIQRHVDLTGVLETRVAGLAARVASKVERLVTATERGEGARALGRLLFDLANLARNLGIDAESALREANVSFEERFRAIEGTGQGPTGRDDEGLEARPPGSS